MLRHCDAFEALKCSFDINVGFLEMRSCYDQMSSHNFAMSRTPPPSQSLSHGYGSKQRRECRTADTLSTELSQHNIYSFYSAVVYQTARLWVC